jgi:pimeloyl-ACP methyl ester carboxylesterase
VVRTWITLALFALSGTATVTATALDPIVPVGLPAGTASPGELVVLVHGLGRTPISMLPLEWALEGAGYDVLNWGYSSVCCEVPVLARQLAAKLDEEVDTAAPRIHFVGHSLGNIIVRSMLATDPPKNVGRVVMLAPPNRGSAAATRYEPLFGWLLKPLADLTTDRTSRILALRLPPTVEVGVIAGEHDGKVSVAESHLDGERDHVVVPSAHTFIMVRSDVHRLVTDFLRSGSFSRASL